MRRRPPPATLDDPDGIPVELLAGPCLEVWAPLPGEYPYTRGVAAYTRWRAARDLWAADRGLHPQWDRLRLPAPLQKAGPPWSWRYLAEHDRRSLAAVLTARGLPRDWQPTPAGPEWDRPRPRAETYADYVSRQ